MKKLNLKDTTVGELKEFLRDIPDHIAIDVWGEGDGILGSVELQYIDYKYMEADVELNIETSNSIY